MIVTCWYRLTPDGWKFNHVSDGFHPLHEEPAWMFESQERAWDGAYWLAKLAMLVNGKIQERRP